MTCPALSPEAALRWMVTCNQKGSPLETVRRERVCEGERWGSHSEQAHTRAVTRRWPGGLAH